MIDAATTVPPLARNVAVDGAAAGTDALASRDISAALGVDTPVRVYSSCP